MTAQTFLPYRYAADALNLVFTEILIDGKAADKKEFVDPASSQLSFSGLDPWSTISLSISVTDTNRELLNVVLDGEDATDCDLFLVSRNKTSRFRTSIKLDLVGENEWQGNLPLDRDSHYGTTDLQVIAVRKHDGKPDGNRALRAFERLADSAVWHIYVDDKPPTPGGAIDGQWKDFAESDIPGLKERASSAWYLDLENPDRPQLYLNEAIAGLRRALEAPQKSGHAACIRQSLEHSILQPILMEMAVFSITYDSEATFEGLPAWQRSMLESMAAALNLMSERAQAEEWMQIWRNGQQGKVLSDLGSAAQLYLKMPQGSSKLIATFGKNSDD